MPRTIQASEAKSHLLQILDEVERGETVVITRRGRPIARLEPEFVQRRAMIEAAIQSIREHGRRNGKITAEDLLAFRDEGRRS